MTGWFSHATYLLFLIIVTSIILFNYKGLVNIMKQGGETVSGVSQTLIGTRPSNY